ncbi:NAD-dependent epimerase/dehydratase family protein [Pyrobaculum sp.]|uniref:NAD-dependent epimerase/dehydratase family protein n=1 Tax=Pyrobaculum sp. TaxID=2004705 RepID=UPI003D0DD68B
MRIHITGVAGVLGSALARALTEAGYEVQGNDVVRREEAWRLSGVDVTYLWKATQDLEFEDLAGVDVVIDAGIAVADRPLGFSSPLYTAVSNIVPHLRLMELARRMPSTVFVLPSSFNALYGHGRSKYLETLLPLPSSVYGWTKAAAELLYHAYARSYGVKTVITRVASSYGPGGRADELPHKMIIYGLRGRIFVLRSPDAVREWVYIGDVVAFYRRLLERLDEAVGKTFHVACTPTGPVKNKELAEAVRREVGLTYVYGDYEPGETAGGSPISFRPSCRRARELGWRAVTTLEEGIRKTVAWFRENLWRYA